MSCTHFAKKIIPINIVDYDHYIKQKSINKRIVIDAYAVFLDINLPYQSDLKLIGLPAINPIEYYASLNRFFRMLEEKFAIKIVIAAHPKTDCSTVNFPGRTVYFGKTAELSKKC